MMMLAEQSAFMKSACVQVLTSDARATVVGHTLSGRKYALGGDAFRLFDSLGQPTTVAHLRELLPHLEPSRLAAALEHLQQQQLIVRCTEEIDETFQVTALAPTLCNVEAFNPAVAVPPRVVFLGVPYGGGNYLSGATARFPRVVRKYSRRINADFRKTRFVNTDGDLFDVDASIDLANLRSLVDDGGIADWGNLFIHPQEYPRHVYDNVQKAAGMLLDRGHIPFVLGGDHSITLPVLQAFAGRVPNLHVLHFDAHTDTYDSPLDHVFEQRATHGFGNFASHALRLEHVAAFHQIGIRGINNFGVKAHPKQHIHWIAESKRAAREHRAFDLPADVPWYVTIDIDVLDPAVAPGTASPVPGGLAVPEFLQLLHVLLAGRRVVGVDLVEINPERDRDDVTVQIGLETIVFILNLLHPGSA
jgi:agmatinase